MRENNFLRECGLSELGGLSAEPVIAPSADVDICVGTTTRLAWGQASQPLRLEKTIELPEVQGRIDHLSVDVKGQRLFVSALGNNTVEVIDIRAGKRVKTIRGRSNRGVLDVDEPLRNTGGPSSRISRWMKRAPRDPDPAKRWLAFLRNHREEIAAMDFFTVPTITFGVLCCFFVISHDRRRILHFNVTNHPTSLWTVQQLREAFPFESAPRFLIFDRDAKYGLEVPRAVRSMKIRPVRTSFESPWQNGVAERWVESCRRDLLNHIVAVNERHLKRLLSEYVRYYHEDRTHLGLGKGTPNGRIRSVASGRVLSQERLGGLHHRYDRAA